MCNLVADLVVSRIGHYSKFQTLCTALGYCRYHVKYCTVYMERLVCEAWCTRDFCRLNQKTCGSPQNRHMLAFIV